MKVDVGTQPDQRVRAEDHVVQRFPLAHDVDERGRRLALITGRQPAEHRIEPVERVVQELASLPVRGLGRDDPGGIEVDGGAAAGRRAGGLGRVLHVHTYVAAGSSKSSRRAWRRSYSALPAT